MLPIEREMIAILFHGASTPLDNIRVSGFLVAWSASVLAIVRMTQHEKENQAKTEGFNPGNPGSNEEKPKAGEKRNARDEKGGITSLIQPAKRSH
jgi:hypothetical protein